MSTRDILDMVAADNIEGATDIFTDVISEKIAGAIAQKRIEVSQSMFNEGKFPFKKKDDSDDKDSEDKDEDSDEDKSDDSDDKEDKSDDDSEDKDDSKDEDDSEKSDDDSDEDDSEKKPDMTDPSKASDVKKFKKVNNTGIKS